VVRDPQSLAGVVDNTQAAPLTVVERRREPLGARVTSAQKRQMSLPIPSLTEMRYDGHLPPATQTEHADSDGSFHQKKGVEVFVWNQI